VEGAKKAGLHTVLLDRDGKQQGVGIRTIKNLEELFQLLERFEE
jgi:FMN phosphatase YigB (HAD superfamily)